MDNVILILDLLEKRIEDIDNIILIFALLVSIVFLIFSFLLAYDSKKRMECMIGIVMDILLLIYIHWFFP